VRHESGLLLRFLLSFEFFQRIPSLRVLALFFRQRLCLIRRRRRRRRSCSFGRSSLIGSYE
jgi:hypothetical protein